MIPGVCQIRAFDLSNITFIEGKEGITIIDPLVSCWCDKAALDIDSQHRGHGWKIQTMIYSHSHGGEAMVKRWLTGAQASLVYIFRVR